MSEQEIIEQYFSRHQIADETVVVGIGDDAAIVNPPDNSRLVITTDTLNEEVHFYKDCDAQYVGHKSLAVNLSDIAAMGAIPLWATLNLSLPEINHAWLKNFSNGLYALADQFDVKIIGGDLVKGPLSVTLTVIGYLNSESQLLRSTCQTDDLIFVTGSIGDAAFGSKLINDKKLKLNKDEHSYFTKRLYQPVPRLDVSQSLVGVANSAIDLSDGFLIDLKRILSMSLKGAIIDIDKIPISKLLQPFIGSEISLEEVLCSGDDYQLLFTVSPSKQKTLEKIFFDKNILITQVGKIVEEKNITLMQGDNVVSLPGKLGFDHFL